VKGATKTEVGGIDEPVEVGGATIRSGDAVVLDVDGAVVVRRERVEEVLAASRQRLEQESVKRERLRGGQLSYDLDGLRARVEGS
jgi:4-hydroxy-4-methyl-2-oxoglutarate aldolase